MGLMQYNLDTGFYVLAGTAVTEYQLDQLGFDHYLPVKRDMRVARMVSAKRGDDVPWIVEHSWGQVVGREGDVAVWRISEDTLQWMIRFSPDNIAALISAESMLPNFVEHKIFHATYNAHVEPIMWDEFLGEGYLFCWPMTGVWALKLNQPLAVYSLESGKPTRLEADDYLCIKSLTEGAFYGVKAETFIELYGG